MRLIIFDDNDRDREGFRAAVTSQFPEVEVHAFANEADIGDLIETAEILLTRKISNDLLKRAKNLKWIQLKTSGVNYILDLPSYTPDILLTSSRGIHGPQVSEIVFLFMLALNRKFHQNILNQQQRVWQRWPGMLLWQKKVGILGVGVIGKEIAKKCKAFGMTVYGITTRKRNIDSVDQSYGPEDLLTVMREVDYVINVLPYTPETAEMIGAETFSKMKSTAFFINVGRGGTVDENALIDALKTKTIAGAGLDVFGTEPLPKSSPLWELDNVFLSPHVAGMSDFYVTQVFDIFGENLRRFLLGEREHLINRVHSPNQTHQNKEGL